MVETVTTTIVMTASCLLFVFWFRSACLLILVAKPPRDYARGVAIANQLAFQEVQEGLCNTTSADLRSLREALDRDFRVLSYLLKHATAIRDDATERLMLRVDYWTMGAWCWATSRGSPLAARRALQEMANGRRSLRQHVGRAVGHRPPLPIDTIALVITCPRRWSAMLNWLARLWHKIDGWLRPRPLPNPYHRSNLHARHR